MVTKEQQEQVKTTQDAKPAPSVRDAIDAAVKETQEKEDHLEDKKDKELVAKDKKIDEDEVKEKEIKEEIIVKTTKEEKEDKTETTEEDKEDEKVIDALKEPKEKKEEKEVKEKEIISAPVGIPKEVRKEFSKLPSVAQNYIVKAQKELSDLKAEAGRNVTRYRDMDTVLTPYAAQMQQSGVTPAQVVHRLLKYIDELNAPNTKYDSIQQLAKSFDIDLTKFGRKVQEQTQTDELQLEDIIPPEIVQKLDTIVGEINSLKQSQQSERGTAAEIEATNAVNIWAGAQIDATTGNVSFKNKPYFPYVRQMMSQFLNTGMVPPKNGKVDLDAAYEMAIYANSEVREIILEEKEKVEEAEAEKAQKTRMEALRKLKKTKEAGSSLKPGAPGYTQSISTGSRKDNKPISVRDSINSAIREIDTANN